MVLSNLHPIGFFHSEAMAGIKNLTHEIRSQVREMDAGGAGHEARDDMCNKELVPLSARARSSDASAGSTASHLPRNRAERVAAMSEAGFTYLDRYTPRHLTRVPALSPSLDSDVPGIDGSPEGWAGGAGGGGRACASAPESVGRMWPETERAVASQQAMQLSPDDGSFSFSSGVIACSTPRIGDESLLQVRHIARAAASRSDLGIAPSLSQDRPSLHTSVQPAFQHLQQQQQQLRHDGTRNSLPQSGLFPKTHEEFMERLSVGHSTSEPGPPPFDSSGVTSTVSQMSSPRRAHADRSHVDQVHVKQDVPSSRGDASVSSTLPRPSLHDDLPAAVASQAARRRCPVSPAQPSLADTTGDAGRSRVLRSAVVLQVTLASLVEQS